MASVAFVERILVSSGKLFLVGAVSVDKGMRIVGQYMIDYFMSNYHGLGVAYKCQYNGSAAVCIKYKGKTSYILFAGGYNSNSQDFIQGSTFNGVYLTEINILNLDFIQQCCQRIISFPDAFLYGTLNPKGPNDAFYKQFLFRWYQEQLDNEDKEWLNFNKFYLEDNPILTKEMIEDAKMGYDPDSLRYKRDILCQRVEAEGSIYRINEKNIIKTKQENYIKIITVADFGETISATYFGAYGLFYDVENGAYKMDVIKEWHHLNNDGNAAEFKYLENYCDDYVNFIKEILNEFSKYPDNIFFDGTTETFFKLKKALLEDGVNITPKYVIKEKCEERVQAVQNALYNGKLRIWNKCQHLIRDLKNAVYDTKLYESTGKFQRLEVFDGEGHGDSLDSLDYGITYFKKELNLIKGGLYAPEN